MSFTLSRGLSNVFIAPVIADDADNFTTGTPYQLMPAGEMSISVDNDQQNYHFDNTVFATVGREGASEVTISGAKIRPADLAVITGKTVDETTGAVLDAGEFVNNKYWALGAKTNNIDGTEEYFWFAKGSFALPDESAKTKGEDTDASGTELKYNAVSTVHVFEETNNVHKRTIIDTEQSQLAEGADWFAQVVTPANIDEIVSAVSPASA